MPVALIAVQLAIGPDDLVGPDALRAAIATAVDRAVEQAGQAPHRLIVVPEAIGLAALVALAPPRARDAGTLGQLLGRAAMARPLAVLRGALESRTLEPRHAALVGLAPDGDRFVRETFARLARKHRAHLVAGSHLRIDARGEVVASSYAFDPDGKLLATTDKVNLLAGLEDRRAGGLGLARGLDVALPRIPTPFGPIGVLVGYDGFCRADSPDERFVALGPMIAKRGGLAVVAHPAASPWRWNAAWLPGHPETTAERWRAAGLPATLAADPVARWGVTAHLVGRILDLAFEGESEILRDGGEVVARAGRCDDAAAVTWVASELG